MRLSLATLNFCIDIPQEITEPLSSNSPYDVKTEWYPNSEKFRTSPLSKWKKNISIPVWFALSKPTENKLRDLTSSRIWIGLLCLRNRSRVFIGSRHFSKKSLSQMRGCRYQRCWWRNISRYICISWQYSHSNYFSSKHSSLFSTVSAKNHYKDYWTTSCCTTTVIWQDYSKCNINTPVVGFQSIWLYSSKE